jgi:hypothetical protein
MWYHVVWYMQIQLPTCTSFSMQLTPLPWRWGSKFLQNGSTHVPDCTISNTQTYTLNTDCLENLKSNIWKTYKAKNKKKKKKHIIGYNAVQPNRNSEFQKSVLSPSSTACSYEMSAHFYQNTWHHIPEHRIPHRHCSKNHTLNLPSGFRFK